MLSDATKLCNLCSKCQAADSVCLQQQINTYVSTHSNAKKVIIKISQKHLKTE